LGEVEDRSSRDRGDGGKLAASVKLVAAAVACARERLREKEKRKKPAWVLIMN
jgi:hypothetical protein